MLNLPTLKFEKSSQYLKEQLKTQKKNKKILQYIISKDLSDNNTNLDLAKEFLNNSSTNIDSIKNLQNQINSINNKINEIVEKDSEGNKTKEFYIDSLTNIKDIVEQCLEKFDALDKKLISDNDKFNEYINSNFEITDFDEYQKDFNISKDVLKDAVNQEISDYYNNLLKNAFSQVLDNETINSINNKNYYNQIDSNNTDINGSVDNHNDNINVNANTETENTTKVYTNIKPEDNIETNDNLEIENNIESNNSEIENSTEYDNKVKSKDNTEIGNTIKIENSVENNDKNISSDNIDNNANVENSANTNNSSDISNTSNSQVFYNENFLKEKIKIIEAANSDNDTLIISEKSQKIYLPFKVSDLINYTEKYSKYYKTPEDVVKEEYILPFSYFNKHPSKSRFSQSYDLLRREGNNFVKSVSYAFRLLKKYNLNPSIIASCKTQKELEDYLYCLDSNTLDQFKHFKIVYDVNPL